MFNFAKIRSFKAFYGLLAFAALLFGNLVARPRGRTHQARQSAAARPQRVARAKRVPSAMKAFSQSTREEREEFFDFLRRLKGVPQNLDFPASTDDDTAFESKSVAVLTELDRQMSDPNINQANWVRRTAKHLKVKSGFSEWFKSINARMKNLEHDVAAIKRTLGSRNMTKAATLSRTPSPRQTKAATTARARHQKVRR